MRLQEKVALVTGAGRGIGFLRADVDAAHAAARELFEPAVGFVVGDAAHADL